MRIKESLSIIYSTHSMRQILIKICQYSCNETIHPRNYLGLDCT